MTAQARIDTRKIRASHDCRRVMEQFLGPPRMGGGSAKAWSWRCPFHHEQHGYSLVGYEDGFSCFGACGIHGDVIEFVMRMQAVGFLEAVRLLDGEDAPRLTGSEPPVEREERDFEWPPETWLTAALALRDWSVRSLWQSEWALRYLREQRFLTDATIRAAQIGFVPGDFKAWLSRFGLKFRAGIVLPWALGGSVVALNVRRLLPAAYRSESKYCQVQGSAKGVFGIDQVINDGRPLVFVEGEFDCLLLRQWVGDQVSVVTLGSGADRLYPCWRDLIVHRDLIDVVDKDDAGLRQVEHLAELNPGFRFVAVPVGKDLTDFVGSLPGELEEKVVLFRRWWREVL